MPASWRTLPVELQVRILRLSIMLREDQPQENAKVPQLNLKCLQIDTASRRLSIDILEHDHYFIAFEMNLCDRCVSKMRGYMYDCALTQSQLMRGLSTTKDLEGVSQLHVSVRCGMACGESLCKYPIWLIDSDIVEALSVFELCHSGDRASDFAPTIAFTATITNPIVGIRIAAYRSKFLAATCISPCIETISESIENGVRRLEMTSTVPPGQPTRDQVLEMGLRWLSLLRETITKLPMHQMAHNIEQCCGRFDAWTEPYREEADLSWQSGFKQSSIDTIHFHLLSLYFESQAKRLLEAPNTVKGQTFLSLVDDLGNRDLRSWIEQTQRMIKSQPSENWEDFSEHVEAAFNVVRQRTELYLALARTASLSNRPGVDLFRRGMSWTRFCVQGLALIYFPRVQAIKVKFDSEIRPFLKLSPPRGPRDWRCFSFKPYWWGKPPTELITRAKKDIAWIEGFTREHSELKDDFEVWRTDIRGRISSMESMIQEFAKTRKPIP